MADGAAHARHAEGPREASARWPQADPWPSSHQEERPATARPTLAPLPLLGWLARRYAGASPVLADVIVAEEPVASPAVEPRLELAEAPLDRPDEPSDAELARVIMSLPPLMAEAAIAAGVLGADHAEVPSSNTTASVWSGPSLVEDHRVAASIPADPSISRFAGAPGMVLAPLGGGWHAASEAGWRQRSVATMLAGINAPANGGPSSGASGASLTTSASVAGGGLRAPIQLAATDRPEAGDHGHDGPSAAGDEQPPTAASGAVDDDQDQLVEEVFRRLRWRLQAERERQLSWG
jgi:hypothetical protein